MSETYVIAPDGTPERLIQRLENATSGDLFYCEADREEALEIAQEEFATVLAEAEARGRRQGLEEAAKVADKEARDRKASIDSVRNYGWVASDADHVGRQVAEELATAIRSLATAPAETQKPETGESVR